MSENLFLFLLSLPFAGLMAFGIWYSHHQRNIAKKELASLVKQAGGSNISVHYKHMFGTQGVFHFTVRYINAHGQLETHTVARTASAFSGTMIGDYYWDKPLVATSDAYS